MDGKGYAFGVTGRNKRIFYNQLYGKKQFKQSLHDNNHERVTLPAGMCGDGTALLPGTIYMVTGNIYRQAG